MTVTEWEQSERKELWEAIFEQINRKQPLSPKNKKPLKTEAYLTTGEKEILLGLVPTRKCIKCHLWITRDKDFYKQLYLQRATIEAEIGQPLRWEENPGQASASIYLEEMIDPKDPANREKVIAWFAAYAVPFYNAFRSKMDRLYVPAPDAYSDNEADDA